MMVCKNLSGDAQKMFCNTYPVKAGKLQHLIDFGSDHTHSPAFRSIKTWFQEYEYMWKQGEHNS